jgi:hypothetical protein
MKRIFFVVACLAVAALFARWIAWANDTYVRRQELLAIRAAITPGMTREEVARVIRAHVQRTLFRYENEDGPLLCVHEADYFRAWILSVSFNKGRAVAVHIGDGDNIFLAPRGAPPALVWGNAEQPALVRER